MDCIMCQERHPWDKSLRREGNKIMMIGDKRITLCKGCAHEIASWGALLDKLGAGILVDVAQAAARTT